MWIFPFQQLINLFDKIITSILLYESEISGYEYSYVITGTTVRIL